MVKVSVIVPVFNAAKYLPECLHSIRRQTLKEIEVICVDDGSTDDSAEIVRAFARLDSRFRLLQQENAGAGVARNAALAVATGEYLSFCDPDDWYDAEMLEAMYATAGRERADVVMCALSRFDSATRREISVMRIISPSIKGRLADKRCLAAEELDDCLLTIGGNGPCNKLFRHEIVKAHGLRFQPLRRTNDLFFVKSFLAHAERLAFLERPFYHYRRGISSATTNDALAGSFCFACEAVRDHLSACGLMTPYRHSFCRMVVGSFIFNFRSISSDAALERWFADVGPRVKRMLSDCPLEAAPTAKLERSVFIAVRDDAPLADFRKLLEQPSKKPAASAPSDSVEKKIEDLRCRISVSDQRIANLRTRIVTESRALQTQRRRAQAQIREVNNLKMSIAYRVGMLVTWPLRKIYRGLRKRRGR